VAGPVALCTRTGPGLSSNCDMHRRILASTVTLNNLTTQELLKHAEDMMREDQEFLKDFNAAVDQLLKKKEEFQAEHPPFGRYS